MKNRVLHNLDLKRCEATWQDARCTITEGHQGSHTAWPTESHFVAWFGIEGGAADE